MNSAHPPWNIKDRQAKIARAYHDKGAGGTSRSFGATGVVGGIIPPRNYKRLYQRALKCGAVLCRS